MLIREVRKEGCGIIGTKMLMRKENERGKEGLGEPGKAIMRDTKR